MQVIVHGGAGGSPTDPQKRRGVLDEAANAGANESGPLSAVEAAIHVLESSDRFNAGYGGAVQSDGAVRTDAGVMTSDREVGAVCSTPGIEHAVSAARVVMEETPHVFVSGEYAVEVAEEYGVETERELLTDENRERFEDADPPEGGPGDHLAWLSDRFGGDPDDPEDHDTVGAVARHEGSFAAATSTGGRWFALAGRVGDVPQVGSGFYCSPAGGASATGAGEDIARVTLSRRAVQYLEDGADAETAARNAIDDFGDLTEGSAGVIVLGEESAGRAFNSDAMQTAVARR